MSGKLLRGPWPAKDAIDKIRAVNQQRRQADSFDPDDYLGFLSRMRIDTENIIERVLSDLPKPQGYCDPDKTWTSITLVTPIDVPGDE